MIDSEKYCAYAGDGVYVCFDGYGFWLRTGDHREELCNDKIYLEPAVLQRVKQITKALIARAEADFDAN